MDDRPPIHTDLKTVRKTHPAWPAVQPLAPGWTIGREEHWRTGLGATGSGKIPVLVAGDNSVTTDDARHLVILGPAADRGDPFDLWAALNAGTLAPRPPKQTYVMGARP